VQALGGLREGTSMLGEHAAERYPHESGHAGEMQRRIDAQRKPTPDPLRRVRLRAI
jgi:hypothetical protein